MSYGVVNIIGDNAMRKGYDMTGVMCGIFVRGSDTTQEEKAHAAVTQALLVVTSPMVRLCQKLGVSAVKEPPVEGVYLSDDGENLYDYFDLLDKLFARLEGRPE